MVNAGLPNITGTLSSKNTSSAWKFLADKLTKVSGAFSVEGEGAKQGMASDANPPWGYDTLNFDASKSNPIYGSSDTVTPLTYTVRVYICYA